MKLLDKLKSRIGVDLLSFLSHSKNYISADFFQKGLVFLSIPIFTRILTPEEYGLLSIFTSLVTIFTVFTIVGGRGALVRYYHEVNYDFSRFIGSIILFYFIYLLIFGLSSSLCYESLAEFIKTPSKVVLYAIIVSIFLVFSSLYLSFLQAAKNSKRYSIISVSINSVILIASIIWMILLTKDKYFGRIYAQLAINGVFTIFFIYNLIKIANFNFKLGYVKDLLKFGVPLIPHALSGIILVYFDRIIINQLVGAEKTGLYSFAYNVGLILQIFILAMNRAWQPMFYEYYTKRKFKTISNIAQKYTHIVYYIAILLVLFAKEISAIMATKQYSESLPLIPIVILSYLFLYFYTIYSNYSFYHKKPGAISLATMLATIVNVVLNYLFIPVWGYVSAAYTTLFSYVLLFLFHYLLVKYYFKEKELIKVSVLFRKFLWIALVIGFVLFEYSYIQNIVLIYTIKILFLLIITLVFILPYLKSNYTK